MLHQGTPSLIHITETAIDPVVRSRQVIVGVPGFRGLLSPDVSSDHLIAFQSEIQELQRQLLKVKLTCREQLMATFTNEQWDNFAFIISDNPKLASLMPQVQAINHGTYSQVARH